LRRRGQPERGPFWEGGQKEVRDLLGAVVEETAEHANKIIGVCSSPSAIDKGEIGLGGLGGLLDWTYKTSDLRENAVSRSKCSLWLWWEGWAAVCLVLCTRVLDLSVESVRSEDEVENEVELSKTSISDSSSEVSEILGFPRLEPGQHGMG
jgi:hypothetical protein